MKIKNYVNKYGLRTSLRHLFAVITNFESLHNWRCKNLVINQSDYRFLKRKYAHFIASYNKKGISNSIGKQVWTCWLQGEDSAPDIVKACWNSIREQLPEYKFVIITEENINEYVKFPDYINYKWRNGRICSAHYTDLLRIELLDTYGGMWFDSTLLCTGRSFIDYLNKSGNNLFVFKDIFSLDQSCAVSNWFMASSKDNDFIKCLKSLLYKYWEENDRACNYFIFHIFFMIIKDYFEEEWSNIPTFLNANPHVMQTELLRIYDKKRYSELCFMSDIHKLTYKIRPEKNMDDTVFSYILKRYVR